jgi:two-component sensor histidine kinase
MALGRAQELVRPTAGRKNEGALLGDLISILLAPYDEKEASVRIRVSVPKMKVGEASSTTLALVIHELATNSAKYGARSVTSGTLDVSCNANDDEVAVIWTERGGHRSSRPWGPKASEVSWYTEAWPPSLAVPSHSTGPQRVWS